jgi:dimethylhistidine N-methyltransferase
MTQALILPELEQSPALFDMGEALIREVENGLASSPRSLAPWMFYDAWGSCLFERITTLAEYYPSRIEREILARFAEEIVGRAQAEPSQTLRIFELGAGTAAKTGILLEAAKRRHGRVTYVPYDVSPDALAQACTSIESILPSVHLQPIVGNYVTHPPQLARANGTTLALYIGSSIGNFSPEAARTILCNLRSQMSSGDALLLGTDMVKEEEIMLAAYDDREGVTADFNLNVLRRLNRELRADFDFTGFRHQVRWNHAESRIEMHLESLCEQDVRIPAAKLDVHFAEGETIHTENSYKFTQDSIRALLDDTGFKIEQTWKDPRDWYALTLAGLQ